MNTKYTPGPWLVYNDMGIAAHKGIDSHSGKSIVLVGIGGSYGGVRGATKEEAEANARLIACAPELLEALKAAIDYINNCPCDPDIFPKQLKAWDKLSSIQPMKLIAKAGGE